MNFKLISVIAFLFLLFSCSDTQEKKVSYDVQKMAALPLEGELMQEELLAPNTQQMKFIQKALFHFSPQSGTACLVTDMQGDTLGYVAGIGNGPGELNRWPYYAGASVNQDTLYMFDTVSKKLHSYHVHISSDEVNYEYLGNKPMNENKPEGILDNGVFKLLKLENGYHVGLRMLTSCDLFTLYDENLNEVKRFGEYPFYDGLDKDVDFRLTTGFNGYLEVKGNSLYYATTHFAYMARFDISDKGEVTSTWRHFYAKVNSLTQNNEVRFYGDNIQGFMGFAVGKNHIFASYSGAESGEARRQRMVSAIYPKTLLVLDLNGVPLVKFDLGKKFVSLCLDDDEEYLYVKHTEPDVSLYRYKVSDIMKLLPQGK